MTQVGLEYEISVNDNKLLKSLKESGQAIGQFTRQVESDGESIENTFKRIAATMGVVFGVAQLKNFVQAVTQVRGEFQQLEIAFETMLGSKSKADALMTQLIDTAAKTPFDLRGIAQGAKQLLAYGTAAEDINETLKRLGNIASGLSIPLGDLVYLYGTTQTQGRVFTQDMRQFMGRGIPLAQELAKQFGKTTAEINEMVTAGQIGFEHVKTAIENMTNEGGKFYRLMEKQSESLTGQLSNLSDAWDVMLNDIGESSQGVISSAIGGAATLVENYKKVVDILKEIIVVYGSYKAAVALTAVAQKALLQAEGAILAKTLTLEQQQALGIKNINALTAEQIVLIKAKNAAQLKASQSAAAAAAVEVRMAKQAIIDTRLEMYAIKEKVVTLKAELAAVTASGNAKKTAAAQKRLDIALDRQSTLVKDLRNKKLTIETIQERAQTAAKAANTAQTTANTVANAANTASHNLLTAAKTRLLAISKSVNATLAANAFSLTIAAVAGLAYGIYKLVTAEAAEEKALRKLNEELEQQKEARDAAKSKADELRGVINDSTKTLRDHISAWKELKELFPEIFSKMTLEDFKKMSDQEYGIAINVTANDRELKSAEDRYKNALARVEKLNKDYQEAMKPSIWGEDTFLVSTILKKLKEANTELENAKKILDKIKSDDEDAANEQMSKSSKTVAERITDINKEIKETSANLAKLRAGDAILNVEEIDKAEATLKSLREELEKLTGQSKEVRKDAADRLKAQEEYGRRLLDAENQLEASRIALMKDGKEKRLKEIDLEHKQTLERINRERDELIKAYNEANGTKLTADNYGAKMPEVESNVFAQRSAAAKKAADDTVQAELDAALKIDAIRDEVNARFASELENELAHVRSFYAQQLEEAIKAGDQELQEFLKTQQKKEEAAAATNDKLRKLDFDQDIATVELDTQYADFGMTEMYERKKTELLLKFANERIKLLKEKNDEQAQNEVKYLEALVKQYEKTLAKPKSLKFKVDEKALDAVVKYFNKVTKSEDEARQKAIDFFNDLGDYAEDAIYVIGALQNAFGGLSSEVDAALNMAMNAAQGIARIAAGDILGGVTSIVGTALQGLKSLFSDDKKRQKDAERLSRVYEAQVQLLDRLISKYKELLAVATGEEIVKIASDSQKALEDQIKSFRNLGRGYLNSGASSGFLGIGSSHSYGYNLAQDLKDVRPLLKEIGIDLDSLGGRADGIFSLEVEQLEALREVPEIWARLPGEVQSYIESIIEANAEMDKLVKASKEAATATTFDSVADGIIDLVRQTDLAFEDIEDSFVDHMDNALLRVVKNKIISDGLEKWYDDFYKAMSDGELTASETESLKRNYQSIVDTGKLWYDAAREMAGITDAVAEAEPDKSLTGSIKTVSEETASLLAGQINAIRIYQADSYLLQQKQAEDQINLVDLSRQSVTLLRDSLIYHRETAQNTAMLYEMTDILKDIASRQASPATDYQRSQGNLG